MSCLLKQFCCNISKRKLCLEKLTLKKLVTMVCYWRMRQFLLVQIAVLIGWPINKSTEQENYRKPNCSLRIRCISTVKANHDYSKGTLIWLWLPHCVTNWLLPIKGFNFNKILHSKHHYNLMNMHLALPVATNLHDKI